MSDFRRPTRPNNFALFETIMNSMDIINYNHKYLNHVLYTLTRIYYSTTVSKCLLLINGFV